MLVQIQPRQPDFQIKKYELRIKNSELEVARVFKHFFDS
jgi:hypothetical protein